MTRDELIEEVLALPVWDTHNHLEGSKTLAEFLGDQVARGWLDHEAALYVAREWLHAAAARLYHRGVA